MRHRTMTAPPRTRGRNAPTRQSGRSGKPQMQAEPNSPFPAQHQKASDADSSYITGIVLQVMGGETTGG